MVRDGVTYAGFHGEEDHSGGDVSWRGGELRPAPQAHPLDAGQGQAALHQLTKDKRTRGKERNEETKNQFVYFACAHTDVFTRGPAGLHR